MYKDLKITVINPKEELLSFPITQHITLEFSEKLDESLLHNIFIVEDLDLPRLMHIGDTYNQNIGLVKESFKPLEVKYSIEKEEPFTVSIYPLLPLTPSQKYTLLVKDQITDYRITSKKTNSQSDSNISLVKIDNLQEDTELVLKILEDSEYINDKHSITFQLKGKKHTLILSKNLLKVGEYTFKFDSDYYVKDEEFSFKVSDNESKLYSSFLVPFKCSTSKNVKPFTDSNNKITNQDIEKFNSENNSSTATENTDKKELSYTIKTSGYNSFLVLFNKDIVDELDTEEVYIETREAFNMYTLTNLGLYDPFKKYRTKLEKVDSKTIEVFVNEVEL